jgi:hypothetical protein
MNDNQEIHTGLANLVGLELAAAHRAADMRMFQFGKMRPVPPSKIPRLNSRPKGSVGEFALHLQCPWRLEAEHEILTGRSDLWKPVEMADGFSIDEWDYEKDGNIQDLRINQWLTSDNNRVVDSVRIQSHGGFTLVLNSGVQLVVFPSGSASEDWRLFQPDRNTPHLVVSGGRIERDDE